MIRNIEMDNHFPATTSPIPRPATLASLLIPLTLFLTTLLAPIHNNRAAPITVERLDGKLRVAIDGKLFTEYVYSDCENPFLYPVIGPHGIGMTRNFPMRDVPGEERDHLHHTSIWFGHDGINGIDFWRTAQPGHGRVIQEQILRADGGTTRGVIETRNKWVGPDGTVQCHDERVLTFHELSAGRAIDWQITLLATRGDVLIRDTEEGTMGVRTHPNLRLINGKHVTTANGQARNSNGVTGKEVWGKRAEWINYWGKINNQTVGIALFNHPANPRHPTWWHARPYGLFTANPFGRHDFGDGPPQSGNMTIAAGNKVTFRYRFLFHDGPPEQAKIPEQYARYRSGKGGQSNVQHTSTDQGMPRVPPGFQVSLFAREPLVRHVCAMAFDARGRLCVAQGVQYRNPKPDTPGDRVSIVIDTDRDGVADQVKTFADGFNHIQALAWRGNELWIANAPDLTVVRDLDGDDRADQYRIIYGGLGNLEHGLHGLNFAPDGRLYMSKGNSKGYVSANSTELRLAPRAFIELWGVDLPEDNLQIPASKWCLPENYHRGYHHPSDDWGSEGGILRCAADGTQLEIFSRGSRNMWDMAFDEHFNWVGTDQDQDGGDRILSPFFKAHFGWGHPWSSHWTGENHPPTVPVSGPVFHGSGTGVVYGTSGNFPESYRGVFFCADWLNRNLFVFRPQWNGALMRNMAQPEIFAAAPSGRAMESSSGMLFDPTDIEFGPNGALWVASWGHGYGAQIEDGQQVDQGRVFQISYGEPVPWQLEPHRRQPIHDWTVPELINDLQHERLPVWRVNAQDELVRRGTTVKNSLIHALGAEHRPAGATTWLAWTLGRLSKNDDSIDKFFSKTFINTQNTIDERIQALRILAFRRQQHSRPLANVVNTALDDPQPRIRFAAVQAIHQSQQTTLVERLWQLADRETDRGVFYAAWRALGELASPAALRKHLASGQPGKRRAALLALLEANALSGDEVFEQMRLDTDQQVAKLANSFLEKVGTSAEPVLKIAGNLSGETIEVHLVTAKSENLDVRYTLDGSYPTKTTGRRYKKPFQVDKNTKVTAALFKGLERVGPVLTRDFGKTIHPDEAFPPGGEQHPLLPVEITNLRAANGNAYRPLIAQPGELAYANRAYRWVVIPPEMMGHTIIQTFNDDADTGSQNDHFLSFELAEEAIIHVAHDRRIQAKPKWLDSFSATELTMSTMDATYRLFAKAYPKGAVTLGGNTVDGSTDNHSQYVVLVTPNPLTAPQQPTTIDDILTQLPMANPRRGARLFFHQLACGNCHRIGDYGNAFAPNLTNLGTRATPQIIAKSILDPSDVITEGFQTLIVETEAGRVHRGFLRQESGLNLELVDEKGHIVQIPKAEIAHRQRQPISIMPNGFAEQYSTNVIADLIAFITSETSKSTEHHEPKSE